jgi:hypothetical protein
VERKIKIEECGELMIVAGPGAGKPALCCQVARLCYSHCAALGISKGSAELNIAPSLCCNVSEVRIGYLETVTP